MPQSVSLVMRSLLPAVLLLCLVLTPAHAHYPWLTVLEQNPLRFELSWGHEFPRDGILAVERIAAVHLVLPDGSVRDLVLSPGDAHSAGPLADTGLHVLAATQVPSFYSLTADGGKRGSRADYPEALSCSQSENSMKTLISRGGTEGTPGQAVGHPLEILPLADPAALQAGDEFPVRVLFRGAPFSGTLEATWDGYRGDGEYALSAETDEAGEARIPLSSAGFWKVVARMQEPHPTPELCDYQTYTSTLTFHLR